MAHEVTLCNEPDELVNSPTWPARIHVVRTISCAIGALPGCSCIVGSGRDAVTVDARSPEVAWLNLWHSLGMAVRASAYQKILVSPMGWADAMGEAEADQSEALRARAGR